MEYLQKKNIRYKEVHNVADLYSLKHLWPKISGIILSGSDDRYLSDKQFIKDIAQNITAVQLIKQPVLGICYGFQLLNLILGGDIARMSKLCDKTIKVQKLADHCLLEGLPDDFEAQCRHQDKITSLSKSFHVLCKSRFVNQGFYSDENKFYGVQFHPENHVDTQVILDNFIYKICHYPN